MANDHFISRFLTQPWEVGQRVLHFYDFKTDTFGRISSERLFAQQGLHSKETDLFMNKFIETPVAEYVHRLDPIVNPDQPCRKEVRALIAFWTLQSLRVGGARGTSTVPVTLDQFLAGGENILDAMEQHILAGYAPTVVRTNQRLFFTEVGTFAIPLRRGPMLIALPLTPNHFIAFPKRSSPRWPEALEEVLRSIPTLTALSIGVGYDVHRVVLLPESVPADREGKFRVRRSLTGLRANSRTYVEVVGIENRALGLDSWEVTQPMPASGPALLDRKAR